MTYIHSVQIPNGTIDELRAIDEALPTTRPDGLQARYAGASDDGLIITAVWASKADADRFGAELLGPTVSRLFAEGPHGEMVLDYVADDVIVV